MKRLGKSATKKPHVRFDDNVESYDVSRDGRSGEGRIHQFRLDRIEASPFQVRRVFPEREVEDLAESIRSHGLIHEPRARPHPARPGWIELMPGEMRVRALRRLVERGEADEVLQKDAEGNWLVPIKVDEVDDDRAEAVVLSENLDRTDLSAWEWALAWQQRRESLRQRNQPAGVREVAASIGKKYQTVAEYLRVADAISLEILNAAGVVHGGEPDHRRMAALSLAALQRVARMVDSGGAVRRRRASASGVEEGRGLGGDHEPRRATAGPTKGAAERKSGIPDQHPTGPDGPRRAAVRSLLSPDNARAGRLVPPGSRCSGR